MAADVIAGASKILVIKLSALGDFVQALGPFKAIRQHHRQDHITLLTTEPYGPLAEASGLFDAVEYDPRPALLQFGRWAAVRRFLKEGGFQRIYDLQTSGRSSLYYKLFWPGPYPEWSGVARGCSHPHANPKRDDMHTLERQAEQLKMAGLEEVPPPDLEWAAADVSRFDLVDRYALLMPGGAPHRPAKRWPAAYFAGLGRWLLTQGITPVLLGATSEQSLHATVIEQCPGAISLAGQTDLIDIAVLARRAEWAVGNDTGPMHLAAVAGCRSVVLFSRDSDPALCAPKGRTVTEVVQDDLEELSVEEVTRVLMTAAPA